MMLMTLKTNCLEGNGYSDSKAVDLQQAQIQL